MPSDALTVAEEAAEARRSSPTEQTIAAYWPAAASEPSYARSMSDAARAWIDLSSPWRAAFDEAWMSWRQGPLGVGAAIADDSDHIIARGHNQFFHAGPGPISSTHMAEFRIERSLRRRLRTRLWAERDHRAILTPTRQRGYPVKSSASQI